MPYTAAVCTDIGVMRNKNEDNFYLVNRSMPADVPMGRCTDKITRMQRGVVAVFDGMGGQSQGEVAAGICAETLRDHSQDIIVEGVTAVDRFVEDANNRVCHFTEQTGYRTGSTMVMALLGRDSISIYNIGDSRAYLLSKGSIYVLTEDHTVASQLVNLGMLSPELAKTDKRRHQLTQHMGIPREELELQAHASAEYPLRTMDCLLLCSDGVSDVLSGEEIYHLLNSGENCEDLSQSIIEKAIEKGSRDNITALVVKPLREDGEAPIAYSRRLSQMSGNPILPPSPLMPPNPLLPRQAASPAVAEKENKGIGPLNLSRPEIAIWILSGLLAGTLGAVAAFILNHLGI